MWGFLVASRCIFILIMTLLGHRNTATTKKLDFKNSHLTSVGASETTQATNLEGNFPINSNRTLVQREPIQIVANSPPDTKTRYHFKCRYTRRRRTPVYSVLRYYNTHLTKLYPNLNNTFAVSKGHIAHNTP
jgi:hypothetical protein